ncbi:signal transducer and transcription activator isoform X3 [Hermetia illucens]|uniref:signal transducer and transcription activator isoform X3 n=1 Tax=Hermetia illucens TaxID=343691 RepID=UPI0018CC29A3|nr:signal transducer and transcription activator isoform X3 [Hermetia illucens]
MSLWEKIEQRPEFKQVMQDYYQRKCQYELRYFCAKWIETTILYNNRAQGDLTNDEPLFQQIAKNFVQGLKAEFQRNFPGSTNIIDTIDQYPPEDYYRHLRNGILQELQMMRTCPPNGNHQPPHELTTQIRLTLTQYLTNMVTKEKTVKVLCEQFHTRTGEFRALQMGSPNSTPEFEERVKIILNNEYLEMIRQKDALLADLRSFMTHYETVQVAVINELKNWQRSQALGGNGQPYKDNLDEIQDWIEGLLEIITAARGVITKMLSYWEQYIGDSKTILEGFVRQVMHLQESLIISSFIVEKQPPQVMKTNTRFASTVRWLIGQQLGVSAANPQVECLILSEAQAQRYFSQRPMNDCPPHSSGEITNNSSSMEFQPQSRHFTASFRNMQLKKIKRAEKKGTESVMDEKFSLLFYTTTSYGDYRIRAWTLSLPVVVIVHGNQEPQSWATITWDNAFAEITREPFQVPEYVSWLELASALNTKFYSQTKRALTEDNKRFLCEKIFRNEYKSDDTKNYVKWGQFCKEPLPGRTFTFWDWFFAIMKMTKDHLVGPWQADRIVGFINKEKTIEQLRQCQDGTFLLRFSDSELGGITIAWVRAGDTNEVFMLQPWTAKDLNVRALADRINDLSYLRYLYPNIPKDDAFGVFYSPPGGEQRTTNGYVKSIIKAHTPGYSENSGNASYPNTPQHNMQSPNHSVDMMEMGASNAEMYNNYSNEEFVDDDFEYLLST